MIVQQILKLGAIAGMFIALAGCEVDAVAPMRAFDVRNTAETGVPVPIIATVNAAFASKSWCQDEGVLAIRALATPGVGVRPLGCRQGSGDSAVGQFEVSTTLVKTAGSGSAEVAVEEVLGQDLVRFAVFPHSKHKRLLSVGIFLNVPMYEAAKAKLLAMPVFKRGKDTGSIVYTLSLQVTNDLQKTQKFYLNDMTGEVDPANADAVLELQPGDTGTIALDAATGAKLFQQGYVNFFAVDAK